MSKKEGVWSFLYNPNISGSINEILMRQLILTCQEKLPNT